ncbi:MAG: cobalamin biosynthesis protein CobD [Desulfovibrio sp.]|nr:MAG: cobalamin biosynthesis protein CobD [Desulfovibrio sp.]
MTVHIWGLPAPVWALGLPLAALLLDLMLGDPKNWPHPVRLVGLAVDSVNKLIRKAPRGLYGILGSVGVVVLVTGTGAVALLLCWLPWAGPVLALYLGFAGLALGCLLGEGRRVAAALSIGDDEVARRAVGYLVSRDTENMDRHAMSRALAESMSENLNDGLVAPYFYLALGSMAGPWWGVGMLWAYKAASTLDSMWGYRTPEYARLGWAAARLDDVLAWLPARITALAILCVARIQGLGRDMGFFRLLQATARDARRMESPNAGWPMAASAWAMGATMGGPTVYFGQTKDKPRLGPVDKDWDQDRILGLLRLVRASGVISALAMCGVAAVVLFVV